MNTAERFARIHVLLASDAPVGLVIRRGPSKCVATLLWDRARDQFTLGQWLKGRIYERRCDLSPDGKYFLYFAMNGKTRSETGGAWTAISLAPYLKAVALFAKGDCWNGGGLWTARRKYCLNDGYGHTVISDTTAVQRDREYRPIENYGGECPGVYYPRLLRDGWRLLVTGHSGKRKPLVFERTCPGGWTLLKTAHQGSGPPGKGSYWDEHELVHRASGKLIPRLQWEWADVDGTRLVWATEGRLETGQLTHDGLVDERVLADFNKMTFASVKAPY